MGRDRRSPSAAARLPRVRPATVVIVAVMTLVITVAVSALVWLNVGPAAERATPVPAVTVTTDPADAVAGPAAVPGATDPITATGAPELGGAADEGEPAVVVGPGIDLDQHSVDDPASPWVVVNKTRPLEPQEWEPVGLVAVGSAQLLPQAATALEKMIAASQAAQAPLRPATGYRAYGFQQVIYQDYANKWGSDRADRFSARPGFSEHQTGWAVDVYSSQSCRLKTCFADEPAGVWLANNAHDYGFVVRYPRDQEDVTGYKFEPWHVRYVGPELAGAMHEHEVPTLEHMFGLPAAPDYS